MCVAILLFGFYELNFLTFAVVTNLFVANKPVGTVLSFLSMTPNGVVLNKAFLVWTFFKLVSLLFSK